MVDYSILSVLVGGVATAAAIERRFFKTPNDTVVMGVLLAIFANYFLSLLVFNKLGEWGVFFTFFCPLVCHFIFVKFGINGGFGEDEKPIWGVIFWSVNAFISANIAFNVAYVSESLTDTYSIKDGVIILYFIFSGSIAYGVMSISMFLYEANKIDDFK